MGGWCGWKIEQFQLIVLQKPCGIAHELVGVLQRPKVDVYRMQWSRVAPLMSRTDIGQLPKMLWLSDWWGIGVVVALRRYRAKRRLLVGSSYGRCVKSYANRAFSAPDSRFTETITYAL